MNRSTKIRYIIFQILIEIFKKNKNFNTIFDEKIAEHSFNQNEISSFSDSADWNLNSNVLKNHQKHPRGNALFEKYMKRAFNVP